MVNQGKGGLPNYFKVASQLLLQSESSVVVFCFRISILKDQKEQQNHHLTKLNSISEELREKAEALGEKLVETSDKHMELLQR